MDQERMLDFHADLGLPCVESGRSEPAGRRQVMKIEWTRRGRDAGTAGRVIRGRVSSRVNRGETSAPLSAGVAGDRMSAGPIVLVSSLKAFLTLHRPRSPRRLAAVELGLMGCLGGDAGLLGDQGSR